MQSIIWKLSALATVVGMGLTGVVYQQGGFSRPGGAPTAAVKAGGAPAPNVPGQKAPDGKSPPAEPASDPFAGAQSETTADAVPPQLDPTAQGLPPEVADTRSQAPVDEGTGTRTRPRTKARAGNAQPVDEFANQGAPQSASEDAFSTGAGNEGLASAPPKPGVVRNVDPALMEGSLPSDQNSNALTDDDPFGEGRPPKTAARTSPRGGPARSTASRGRPSMNEPEDNALAQAPPAEQNAFDQSAEASFEQRPPVAGKLRSKARSRLIEDSDPPGAAAVAPAAAEVVDSIAQQPQYGPAAKQFPVEGAPQPQIPAGKNRPRMDDEDAFNQGGAAPAVAPAVTSGLQGAGSRTRPQGFPNDGTGVVEQPASIQPDGAEPIPKLNRNATATDQEMPPPVAQGGRRRPNSLVDDGDEGPAAPQPGLPKPPSGNSAPVDTGSRGREPEPEMTDSAISTPTQRRPSKYVLEVDPTESAGGSVNQRPPSEATASRTPNTQVIAVPKRLASNSAFPGTPTGNGGRPRVTIEKRAPATAYIGQPLIYQIVIRNVGTGVAQQVVVEDIVPDGVAMQGSIPQAELVAKKLSWKIGSLAAGEERKISVKV
ncbi:MAG: conserved repeat domain protein, partial [Planctomycetaceae bacterium]|nr:conserved repeat domain protein [Planctomycetaceae bacterium]